MEKKKGSRKGKKGKGNFFFSYDLCILVQLDWREGEGREVIG